MDSIESAICPVLVGREEELAVLETALLSASRGDSQLVLLAGEAGSGKSRLTAALRAWAEESGWAVMAGACADAGVALPYLPLSEAIGTFMAGAGGDEAPGAAAGPGRELAQLFPGAVGEADLEDPARGKLRLFEAALDLFREVASSRGAVLVIDDLQWADASTRDLLDYLARRIRDLPFMILLTYRPEDLDRRHPLAQLMERWRRARLADEVVLRPLSRAEVAEMARATLEIDSLPHPLAAGLWERSEGNPYVVEEILKELLDGGFAASGTMKPRAAAELLTRVPKRVSEGILMRVARMPPEQVATLECAAVLGRSFSYQTLAAVAGTSTAAVLEALQASVRQQLVEEDPEYPSRYRFRHSLTRDAIYADILRLRREALHGRAAEVLSRQSIARVEVANHLLAAERWEEAVPACLAAAADAVRQRGYAEAAELYARGLAHMAPGPASVEVSGRLGEALWLAGEPAKAVPPLSAAITGLEGEAGRAARAHLRLVLGRCHWEAGERELARDSYEAAREELEALPPSPDLALAYIRLAGLETFEFESAGARRLAEAAVRVAEAANADEAAVWASAQLGVALVYGGKATEGIERIDRAYARARELGYDRIAVNTLNTAIMLRLWSLRAAECSALLDEMDGLPGGWLRDVLGGRARSTTRLVQGELAEALAAADTAFVAVRDSGAVTFVAWVNRVRALVHAELGDLQQAAALLPARTGHEERQDLFFAWWAEARIALARGDRAAAAAVAREVLAEAAWTARLPLLVALAVEAFVAAGEAAAATDMLDAAADAGLDADHPQLAVARARLRLVTSPAEAAEGLPSAIAALSASETRLDELRGRCVLARAHAAHGDRAAAARELGLVLAASRRLETVTIEREAWAAGDDIGLRLQAPPAPVARAAVGEGLSLTSRLSLIHDLRVALRGNQLRLVYQPKVALRDGGLAGVEALARWTHPQLGDIAPDRFVPLAEHTGLVKALTSWAMREALLQVAQWREAGLRLRVNVNLSVMDLEDARLPEAVARAVRDAGVEADALVLELTETGAMTHPQRAIQTLRRIREVGARIAIDDFGIGQSSLAYLKQLPADEIKIDRSFCQDLDERNTVIVRSAVAMGHDLGLTVVAEGVETIEVHTTLREMGCDQGQGYLYGRPMSPADLAAWAPPALLTSPPP